MANNLYVQVDKRNRSKRTGKNYLKHRLIMENKLGRKLTPSELVHHKNENKKDNSEDNLELTTRKEHPSIHAKERLERYGKKCLVPSCNVLTLAWHQLCHLHSSIHWVWSKKKGHRAGLKIDKWLKSYRPYSSREVRKCNLPGCDTMTRRSNGMCEKHHNNPRYWRTVK